MFLLPFWKPVLCQRVVWYFSSHISYSLHMRSLILLSIILTQREQVCLLFLMHSHSACSQIALQNPSLSWNILGLPSIVVTQYGFGFYWDSKIPRAENSPITNYKNTTSFRETCKITYPKCTRNYIMQWFRLQELEGKGHKFKPWLCQLLAA